MITGYRIPTIPHQYQKKSVTDNCLPCSYRTSVRPIRIFMSVPTLAPLHALPGFTITLPYADCKYYRWIIASSSYRNHYIDDVIELQQWPNQSEPPPLLCINQYINRTTVATQSIQPHRLQYTISRSVKPIDILPYPPPITVPWRRQ